jgi:hypothetical protein
MLAEYDRSPRDFALRREVAAGGQPDASLQTSIQNGDAKLLMELRPQAGLLRPLAKREFQWRNAFCHKTCITNGPENYI